MARFYRIAVAATLFGDISVLRTWGRIGTHGRTSIETCASVEDAERAVSHTLRQKMRRGYLPTGQILPPDLAV
jgi:predicted DNA-binding WGR domain protein